MLPSMMSTVQGPHKDVKKEVVKKYFCTKHICILHTRSYFALEDPCPLLTKSP